MGTRKAMRLRDTADAYKRGRSRAGALPRDRCLFSSPNDHLRAYIQPAHDFSTFDFPPSDLRPFDDPYRGWLALPLSLHLTTTSNLNKKARMSLKAELETWDAALKAYDEEDFEKALDQFSKIADSSKILTNMGLIYATLGEHEAAVEQFIAATGLDQYLAVAYVSLHFPFISHWR